jgi:hypothetical protein
VSDRRTAGALPSRYADPRIAVRRPLLLATCLGAALLLLYSCSMNASLTTDGDGRIVNVSSVRIGSSLSRWAVELFVVGGQLAFQLRWIRPAETRSQVQCPAEEAPGELVSALVA